MKQGVNIYKGLTSDAAYDSIGEGLYIDALDIRITTDSGNSQGAITNIKGNRFYFALPTTDSDIGVNGTMEIIGATSIRNTIILFTADDDGNNGWIFTLEYDDTNQNLISQPTIVYKNSQLLFSKKRPIASFGRYESDCIQRVYFSDYQEYFRSLNVVDPNSLTIELGLIDIFPNIKYVQPLLTNVLTGGNLLAGNNQYAYLLTTVDGKESLISPPGNMIHTVQDLESELQTRQYNGNSESYNVGKALEITIDTSNYGGFESITLIHIFHPDLTGTPQVFSVETKNIGSANEIVFIHTGTETTTFEIDLFTYTTKAYSFKTAKTLSQKDNALIVANIKGSNFDVQARLTELGESFNPNTKRFNSALQEDTSLTTDLDKAFNSNFNKDAHWDKAWHDNFQFKFQADGLRLGGQGPNITYNFHLEPFLIDNEAAPDFANLNHISNVAVDLNDGYGNYANNTWDSNASPFISGLLRGYKRGETYRFGIVFYSKKGEASFVEYIGDIKFPDISDDDSVANDSSTTYFPLSIETNDNYPTSVDTTAYAMGIEFNIDFSTCPNFLTEIDSYQIVRLKRSVSDSHRVCSGIMKIGMKIDITSDSGGGGLPAPSGGYNLSGPNDSTDILHLFPYHQNRDNDPGNPGFDYPSGTAFGVNGNFTTLNNNNIAGVPFDAFGSYMTFNSPDVSFDFEGINSAVTPGSCLLMTGRYGQYYSSINTPDAGSALSFNSNTILETQQGKSFNILHSAPATSETLGDLMEDHRRKLRSVGQVDKSTSLKAIEYIKQWRGVNRITFSDNRRLDPEMQNDLDRNLGPYSGFTDAGVVGSYYFRNFYAYLGNSLPGLNDHSDSGVTWTSAFHKGASGFTGSIKLIDTDPLDSTNPLPTVSAKHFFSTGVGAGTGPVRSVSNIAPINGTAANEDLTSTPILDILVPRQEVYGGFTQDALESNIFMPASPVIDKVNTNPKVYGGDIFLNMFTFQESAGFLWDKFYQNAVSGTIQQIFNNNRTSTISMVTESRVNIALSYGATTKTDVEFEVGGSVESTIWRQETDNTKSSFGKKVVGTDHYNMYTDTYNEAYSIESDDLAFFTKPISLDETCNVNDVRAYISNSKINSESVDSWTKFGINNYYDVDDYGPINKIVNSVDEIFFFQDKAVGQYSINPRAVTTTADGIPTELGSSKGFQDHKYITNSYGCIHQWAVQVTDAGIYYWDGLHKKIFLIGGEGGNRPLSEVKGMHGFLKDLQGDISLRKENGGDNPILGKGVHIVKDLVNNEVLFTFHGIWQAFNLESNTLYSQGQIVFYDKKYYIITVTYTSLDTEDINLLLQELYANAILTTTLPTTTLTLVFDELAGQFSSRYSATPPLYIENGDILLSTNPNTRNEVYKHNSGNYGEFYNNKEEAFIKLVLNKDADVNKILRFIEFNSIVKDDQNNINRAQTITGFQVTTEYQDTGKVPFSSGRIKRKFDKWRLKIPRDQNNGSTDRLRSTHFILTLYFDNTYNREIILNRIIHHYDIQMY